MSNNTPAAAPNTAAPSAALPAERPNSALVVIDAQYAALAAAWNAAEVVATIADLVERARQSGTEVVWVRHSSAGLPPGSDQWQIVEELIPAEGEAIVEKTHASSFEDTDFDEVLADRGIGHLIVTGAQSDCCVRSTIHGGFARGYDVTLVSDAHTTEDLTEWGAPPPQDVVSHTNLFWTFESGPGRQARVQESAEVDFGIR